MIAQVGFKAEQRVKQIKELFNKHKKLSRTQIIMATGASPSTITSDLLILCQQNFIKKIKPTSSPRTHYFIKAE